ncbi:MAG: electron transfer flavoprotein subunit beta/FixA family protein [Lachnospiraceae bacterium]|nr:electron transfer flavoprotein subunit beta/FixA family protein [Candidatus Minthocola equi]
MNILVCVKSVPATTKVSLDPVTHTLIRDGRQSVVNPFDMSALEEAICIKEKIGGEVTVLSMGIPDTVRLLKDCLARGADKGMLLSDRAFAGADTLATSYALSCAMNALTDMQLIICGKMAVDGDTAQIGPELAGVLGIPCICGVTEILEVSEEEIKVRREIDGGEAVVTCKLPAVITVVKDIANPRMPSIAGIRFAEEGPIEVKTADDVSADKARCGLNGSPTQVVKTFIPVRDHECIAIEGGLDEKAGQIIKLWEDMGL